MKKVSYFTLLVLFFVACKKGPDLNSPEGKQAHLTELRSQQGKIAAEIAVLEKEIGAKNTATEERFKNVSVKTAETSIFKHFIELQGGVIADQEIYITAKTMGTLMRVLINVGDKVSAGQAVAYLDDAILQKGVEELKTQIAFATDLYIKQKSLWDQGIGSEVQYLSAKNSKESLEKRMESLQEQLALNVVRSPISGVIDEMPMRVGGAASPGIPLAKVVNFSKMKVRANVAEAYAGKVRTGNAVVVNFPDLNKEVSGNIKYISSSINPVGRTFSLDVPLRPNEPNVLPNMIAIVKVIDYQNAKAIVAPINLVQKDASGDFILVADNSTGKAIAKKVPVKVGNTYNDQAEILSGLKTGDQIITVGYQDLNDGDAIKIN